MADIVSIVVSVAMALIMIAVSFYLYTIYCHPQDKGIGTSIGSKIIVIFCQLLSWGQLMLIPLDISNTFGNTVQDNGIQILYAVTYIIIFVFTSFVVPFNIFLYESDQDDSLLKRILWSILFSIAICGIWCIFVFVSYIWLSKYGDDFRVSVPMYMMICMALVGWIFLAINGGVGLVFLPYELIRDFFIRPKPITSEQAFQQKKFIQDKSQQLIKMGQDLKKKEQQFKQGNFNWFVKRKKYSELKSQLEFYKSQVTKLQTSFDIFDQELGGIKPVKDKSKNKDKDADKQLQKSVKKQATSPIIYCLYLFFGILAAILSITWFIQLIGTTINSGGRPLFTLLDPALYSLQQSSVGFLSVGIYSLMVLYLQGCAVKGNIVFGIRIPFVISFHPMKKDRTYLNTFLFNVNIMMLTSIATTQLTVIAFPTYLGQSYLGTFFRTQVFQLPFFGWIYQNRLFMAILAIVFLMSFCVMIFQIVRACLASKKKKQ